MLTSLKSRPMNILNIILDKYICAFCKLSTDGHRPSLVSCRRLHFLEHSTRWSYLMYICLSSFRQQLKTFLLHQSFPRRYSLNFRRHSTLLYTLQQFRLDCFSHASNSWLASTLTTGLNNSYSIYYFTVLHLSSEINKWNDTDIVQCTLLSQLKWYRYLLLAWLSSDGFWGETLVMSSIAFVLIVHVLSRETERQSARMSKITNDGLTRSGTGCFIAVPIWQQ